MGCMFNPNKEKKTANYNSTALEFWEHYINEKRPMGILFNYIKIMTNLLPPTPDQINHPNSRPALRDQAKQFISDTRKHPSKCTPAPKREAW